MKLNRRQTIFAASASALVSLLESRWLQAAAESGEIRFGPAQPFDFEWLRSQARELAARPYQEPVIRHPDILETIDYDAYQQIRFRPERALWEDGGAPFPVQFFHLGRFFKAPVRLYEVADGSAREILYAPDYFTFGKTGLREQLPDDLGFAGFRVMDGGGLKTDWLAYQGAAYFRTSGALDQYGLSARGLAIDTAMPWPEEFPRFTSFWLERTPEDSAHILIYALMDSPSVAGAYRFDWAKHDGVGRRHPGRALLPQAHRAHGRGAADQHVLVRREQPAPGDRLAAGDPRQRRAGDVDRRRRAHLAAAQQPADGADQLVRGRATPRASACCSATAPSTTTRTTACSTIAGRASGSSRSSGWGRGAVQLVEIPTDDEIHDNIVAYWVPATPVEAGSQWSLRLSAALARRRALSADRGRPRAPHPRRARRHPRASRGPEGARKFVIDFEGGPLADLKKLDQVEPVIDASRGRIDNAYALQIVGTRNWRAFFDLYVDGRSPVDLRCFLRLGERTLTETWLYQYIPFEYAQF